MSIASTRLVHPRSDRERVRQAPRTAGLLVREHGLSARGIRLRRALAEFEEFADEGAVRRQQAGHLWLVATELEEEVDSAGQRHGSGRQDRSDSLCCRRTTRLHGSEIA